MKIKIDIDEYFTPEMIKEIAEDELRRAFRQQFQDDFCSYGKRGSAHEV